MKKEYKCICGFVCNYSQKYNAHLRHCKQYLLSVGKYEKMQEANRKAAATGRTAAIAANAINKQAKLASWIAEQHKCERCGKTMTEKFGSGRFCSRTCANMREPSEETKAKIKNGINAFYASSERQSPKYKIDRVTQLDAGNTYALTEQYLAYIENPKTCTICGNILPYEKRFRKTCCDECKRIALSTAGKNSASISVRRSKNEIAFCELCENYFGKENVLHNEPMFDGWDADIILPEYKLAILWNGPWHYRKITADHSLEQVQNRDRLKIAEITTYGFTPYIIKDLSKANKNKVLTEFNLLLKYLKLV